MWTTTSFQVPIFVLTHHPPEVAPKQDERLTFTYLSGDIAASVEQAKKAAGGRAVQVVGGASVVQALLRADLVDELRIDVMPVMLGDGLRSFENIDAEHVRLKKAEVTEVGARTSLAFRVLRDAAAP